MKGGRDVLRDTMVMFGLFRTHTPSTTTVVFKIHGDIHNDSNITFSEAISSVIQICNSAHTKKSEQRTESQKTNGSPYLAAILIDPFMLYKIPLTVLQASMIS